MSQMSGKIVLVTGAAGAIGKPMCVELAVRGATVVMAGRAPRILEAVEQVKAQSGSEDVHALEMDLASLQSVRAGAADFRRRFDRLHVLVNNAAVFSKARRETADGFEEIFGTGHLGHFLLTNLLVDTIKASAPSRVLFMTMDSNVPLNFDDLHSKAKFDSLSALRMTKGAMTCFAVELAERLAGTGVVVNTVNPELTQSTLPKEAPLPLRLVFKLFGASPDKSKDHVIRIACDDEFAAVSGHYFRKRVDKPIPAIYTDRAVRTRLWGESARMVGLAA